MSPLMNAAELMAVFGIKASWFYEREKAGHFRRFEVKPLPGVKRGHYRYSRALVEQYVNGESMVRIGKGARS